MSSIWVSKKFQILWQAGDFILMFVALSVAFMGSKIKLPDDRTQRCWNWIKTKLSLVILCYKGSVFSQMSNSFDTVQFSVCAFCFPLVETNYVCRRELFWQQNIDFLGLTKVSVGKHWTRTPGWSSKSYHMCSIFSLMAVNYLHYPKSLFFKEAIIMPYAFENGTRKWSSFTQGMGQAHNELCMSSWNSMIEFDLNFLDGNFSM